MAQPQHYDAIVIGAGQAGGPLSTALAQAGKRTAIVEREHVGGTCINEGCSPTKTMIASGKVAYLARRSDDYGVHTGSIGIDMRKIRQRKRDIVDSFRSGSQSRLEKTENLDLIDGEARFIDTKTLEIHTKQGDPQQISADLIFINTGARPALPKIDGIDSVPVLNSTTIMELDAVPTHLLVLGGGYIAVEFGQLFRRLGSNVTIVQRGDQLLAREDSDMAQEVAKILQEDTIDLLLNSSAKHVEQTATGIALTARTPQGDRTIIGSHLLVAAGRTPNTDTLNLEAAGVQTDEHGFIQVNDQLESNVPGIYALGDVKGGPAFTHISYDDFRIVRTNLIEGGNATIRDRMVPYTVFMDPQFGRVGLNETEARQAGRQIKIARMPMNYVARALEVDEPRGMMKAIIDAETDQILGCAILGIEGGEVMSMIEIAMMGKLPYTALRDAIFAHPTLAESLNNLFSSVE